MLVLPGNVRLFRDVGCFNLLTSIIKESECPTLIELLDLFFLFLAENCGRELLFRESGNGDLLLDDGVQSLLNQLLVPHVTVDQIIGGQLH